MKHKLFQLLLALSLLFNTFVLIGFAQSRSKPPPAEQEAGSPMLRRISSELNLDPQQAQALADLRAKLRTHKAVFDESMALLQQDFMNELNKQEPDVARLRELVVRKADLDHQRRLAGAELHGDFLATLSPQQRRQLSGPSGAGPRRGNQPPVILRRFDADGDGELDASEMAAAQAQLDDRRRQLNARPPSPRRRTDQNDQRP